MSEPLRDEVTEFDILSREVAYAGAIYDVVREVFDYNGTQLTREFVQHPGAVAVLVLDDDDRALLIQQYRHPIRSRDWEIPAGLLDVAGEPLLDAARRELAEEVDLEADHWSVLADIRTSPGGSDEFVRIYLARSLRSTSGAFDREAEEIDIAERWVSLDEIVDSIGRGEVNNSILTVAALAAFASRARGWSSLRSVDV